jgi:hypothetical protein
MQIKCTSCGASQNLTEGQNCGFCGSTIETEKAQENYKSSTSGEVGNLMMMADTAIDATNWEEALQYFNRALEKDISNSDAWLGKGIAIIRTSKIGDIKTTEAIAYWKNAIKHAPNSEAMSKRVAKEINNVVNSFYPAIENHYIQFHDLDNSYQELVSRFATLENAQDYATQLDNQNIIYLETGLALCNRVTQLPKQYTSSLTSSALTEGFVGQFSSNKYSRQSASRDATNKINKASSRKREIEKYAITINQISEKYFLQLKMIDPSNQFVLEKTEMFEKEIKIKEANAHTEKYGVYYFVGLITGPIILIAIAIPISHVIKIPKDFLMTTCVVGGAVLGVFVADKIVKKSK